jgi:DNA helicase-2/ATP-dependent DNA helicase PcrA
LRPVIPPKMDETTPSSLRERVAARIDDPGFLSPAQRDAVSAKGNFILTACPGSGKTRTVGVRVAWRAVSDPERRIAVTSYTNTAVAQMRAVGRGLGVTLGAQHFTGTLHRFLLLYVLYPFGSRVGVGAGKCVRVQRPEAQWRDVVFDETKPGIRMPVDYFTFDRHGKVVVYRRPRGWFWMSMDDVAAHGGDRARMIKRDYLRGGIVSLDDAMYLAMLILEKNERVRQAVARRFHELVVDEAQDTSDTQLRCLELLHSTGELRSLVLIADLEQSIYRFQGASPEGCAALAKSTRLRDVSLTENWRSSQAICNVTHKFVRRSDPDIAAGEHRDFGVAPELLLYDADDASSVVATFGRRLQQLGLPREESAVLARSHDLTNEINGPACPVDCMKAVEALGDAAGARVAGKTLTLHQVARLDGVVAELAWDRELGHLEDHERWAVRKVSMAVLGRLPSLECELSAWISEARSVVSEELRQLVPKPKHAPSNRLKTAKAHAGVTAAQRFVPAARTSMSATTVHDVKGRSLAAVLLVLDRARGKRPSQSTLFSRCEDVDPADEAAAEEFRIAYVALTRAERYCALGVPSTSPANDLDRFESLGFRRVP